MPNVAVMTIVMADARVAAVPVEDRGESLVPVLMGAPTLLRSSVALRLAHAATLLPAGVAFHVVEGYRPPTRQAEIIAAYEAELREHYGELDGVRRAELSSRFVAPLDVAPHVAGAAIDLTLVDGDGTLLDLGTPVDATPEASNGACYFDSDLISADARELRRVLASALERAGFVNYPTEWWHWSYGDRYWALVSGRSHALYGPVAER